MNERIKELAEQARKYYLTLPTGYKPEHVGMYRELMEKFAELIAAEERESIAKMFDGEVWAYDYREIAAAIRAREPRREMSKPISRSESIKGREIWSGVSKAASSSPTWVRSQVSDASESAARKVRSKPDDPDYRYDKEKFAMLIVKECVDVLNRRFMGDMNREDLEVRRCIADIKEHFGVQNER